MLKWLKIKTESVDTMDCEYAYYQVHEHEDEDEGEDEHGQVETVSGDVEPLKNTNNHLKSARDISTCWALQNLRDIFLAAVGGPSSVEEGTVTSSRGGAAWYLVKNVF